MRASTTHQVDPFQSALQRHVDDPACFAVLVDRVLDAGHEVIGDGDRCAHRVLCLFRVGDDRGRSHYIGNVPSTSNLPPDWDRCQPIVCDDHETRTSCACTPSHHTPAGSCERQGARRHLPSEHRSRRVNTPGRPAAGPPGSSGPAARRGRPPRRTHGVRSRNSPRAPRGADATSAPEPLAQDHGVSMYEFAIEALPQLGRQRTGRSTQHVGQVV